MPLHRYKEPVYFGGMPVTHDLINVVTEGVGLGDGSAIVSPQKVGPHPNAGTYFVAFGEDGLSSNVNRGLKALSENTDFLDDIVHADQSIPTLGASVVPGAPVSSVAISGNIFVGAGTETNDQRTRSGLIAVLDGDGYPLHVLSGGTYVPVLVSKIHDGLGSSVLGSGYYTNPTVDLSTAVPAGQSYRFAYAVRGNLKTQPTKTYTRLANGVRGEEDLWAYVKTTRLGTATFLGDKVFSDELAFEDLVTVTDDGRFLYDAPTIGLDEPRHKISDTTSGNMLWLESGTSTSYRHNRVYVGSDDSPVSTNFGGIWFTQNAKQDPGTGDWIPDSASGLAGLVSIGLGNLTVSQKFGTPASWADSEWVTPASSSDVAMFTSIDGFTITRGVDPSVDALGFFNSQGSTFPFSVNYMDLGQLGGLSYMLAELYQETSDSSPMPARVYATAGDGGSSPKLVSIATNALYDFAAQTWSADTPAVSGKDAYQVGLSGLNGLLARKRTNTVGTWVDSDWVNIMKLGTTSLALASTYEFGWLSNKSITHAISISRGEPKTDGAGVPEWKYTTNDWVSLVNSGSITFPLPIPDGASSLVVEVILTPGAARGTLGNRMRVRLFNRNVDWLGRTGLAFSATGAADARDDGSNTDQIVTVSYALVGVAGEELLLQIDAGNTGAASSDTISAIRVTYNSVRLTNAHKG
jgi:hypothetical protein